MTRHRWYIPDPTEREAPPPDHTRSPGCTCAWCGPASPEPTDEEMDRAFEAWERDRMFDAQWNHLYGEG